MDRYVKVAFSIKINLELPLNRITFVEYFGIALTMLWISFLVMNKFH